jgi:p-aminobenzoyl-glutamate transporter AbgT
MKPDSFAYTSQYGQSHITISAEESVTPEQKQERQMERLIEAVKGVKTAMPDTFWLFIIALCQLIQCGIAISK